MKTAAEVMRRRWTEEHWHHLSKAATCNFSLVSSFPVLTSELSECWEEKAMMLSPTTWRTNNEPQSRNVL